LAYYIGQEEVANSLLRGNKLKVDLYKKSKRDRLEETEESRGDNQVDEKKGNTYTRRSSAGKKEGY
jgi:hypothetical protein